MSFQEFSFFYKERRQFFETYTYQDLLKKVYIKLRKGSEIRFQDVYKFKDNSTSILSDILVDVPQIKLVKDRITKSLETVHTTRESDVCIVYGDYGHGKSQTAHILIEDIKKTSKGDRFIHLENISTFEDFIYNFGKHVSRQFFKVDEENIDKLTGFVKIFESARKDSGASISRLIHTFIGYLQLMSQNNYDHIIILDELDKIINDDTERKSWIDFFVSLNDESELALLLICLIPQRMANQLVKIDRRLERWNHYFNINATILDGKYSTEVTKAIASMLALNDYYLGHSTDYKTLEFVYSILTHKINYLESTSIRNVNTWVLILGEMLRQFSESEIWKHFDEFRTQDELTQVSILKNKMQKLMLADTLPHFELRRDDSDETELFRIEYNESSYGETSAEDGKIKLYSSFMNNETLQHEISVIIDKIKNEDEISVDKLARKSAQSPLLYLLIANNEIKLSKVETLLGNLSNQMQNYPIRIVLIPDALIAPLLLLPSEDNSPYFTRTLQLIINWANIITGHRDQIINFLKNLPTEMIRRSIYLRSLELVDLGISPSPTSPSAQMHEVKSEQHKGIIFLAANIVSTIEETQTFKYLKTIKKNVADTLMVHHPADAIEIMQEFEKMVSVLEDNNFITRGGNKRVTVKKSLKWDQIEAITLLKLGYN